MNRKGEWGQNLPPRFGILEEEGGPKRAPGAPEGGAPKRRKTNGDSRQETSQQQSEEHEVDRSKEPVVTNGIHLQQSQEQEANINNCLV